MVSKAERKPIDFDFQEIDIDELDQILPTKYVDKYRILRTKLFEKLTVIPPGKAFLFGNPKEKLDANLPKNIEVNLNKSLKESGFKWRVCYSQSHKMFAVRPLGEKMVRNTNKTAKVPTNENATFIAEEIVRIACKINSLTLQELKRGIGHVYKVRCACLYVGRMKFHLKQVQIGSILEMNSSWTCTALKNAEKPGYLENYGTDLIEATKNIPMGTLVAPVGPRSEKTSNESEAVVHNILKVANSIFKVPIDAITSDVRDPHVARIRRAVVGESHKVLKQNVPIMRVLRKSKTTIKALRREYEYSDFEEKKKLASALKRS